MTLFLKVTFLLKGFVVTTYTLCPFSFKMFERVVTDVATPLSSGS
jgi:hypothetical protein